MAPKKGKKMNLNEFLGDSTLGSWADEMDALPSAPAARTDEELARDRHGRGRDDFLSTRPDRAPAPPREDLPLPTSPPYTAFIGNLSFQMTEAEMQDHFGAAKIKTVKIIKDRDEKPKGFGYIEFHDLQGLKDALALNGSELSNRTIRVSVAEPPKERPGGGFEDSSKFDSPWRREGPLPPAQGSRDPSRRRFDSNVSERPPSIAEGASDWRSSRPRGPPEPEAPTFRRKNSGFGSEGGGADREEVWTKGSKFQPSEEPSNRFGGGFRSREQPSNVSDEDTDWRSSARVRREGNSPSNSTPPTPQMGRRKLDLLPRSNSGSASPSPLPSPKLSPAVPVARPSPFGAAKPVDVTSREKEVTERIEKDRAQPMSRTSSRTGYERAPLQKTPSSTGSERPPPSAAAASTKISTAPNVSPSISFANMAARKDAQKEE